jgi:nucleotide-binding universal stress UspA family protein
VTYKTIIVHLDCGARRTERLRLAILLADAFDAHLIGVFALDVMRIPSYAMAEAGPVVLDIERKRREEAEAHAVREFRDATALRADNSEWRTFTGEPVAAVAFSARCADLLVIGQLDPNTYETDCIPAYFTEDVLLSAGKPVLVVPYAGRFDTFGRRPLVAWKPVREASRAVWDALPVLKRADTVEVASFERGKVASANDEVARNDMARYMQRHGINGRISRTPIETLKVGEAILSRAADLGADSIVMGAYGHSRLRERVLGGATRIVLDSMTVPVLMSH